MKVLQINVIYPHGSTGTIAKGIHDLCKEQGIQCITAYRYETAPECPADSKIISSYLDCHVHNRLSRWTMLQGCFSFFKTWKFLGWVRKYEPDIVHMHNIHGSYINYWLLFRYFKKNPVKIIWTMHDCWAFTGGCPNYDMIGCEKWKYECSNCTQRTGVVDFSRIMYKYKKKLFAGTNQMILVANSNWTAMQVRQSFLRDSALKVIYNGIDLSVFKPTPSNFRQDQCINNDKKIILGVAFDWGIRKGLDVFVELAGRLNRDKFQIILVGTDDFVDKQLPNHIISIHRTYDRRELAEIYTAADVFVNPTREEALGMVNIEANACGTPVVTFGTGGSPECIDSTSGSVVDKDDIDAMEREIIRICEEKPYSAKACIERASRFNKNARFQEYVDLYKELVK